MRRKLNMEKIRFAVEISNSSVEKLWELLLGDGFFEFLPSFKKRVDTEDGFTIVLKHHKFSVTFDDLVPYSVVSGKVSEYPYHIEFRFTITLARPPNMRSLPLGLRDLPRKCLCAGRYLPTDSTNMSRGFCHSSQNMRTAVLSVLEQILICVCSH